MDAALRDGVTGRAGRALWVGLALLAAAAVFLITLAAGLVAIAAAGLRWVFGIATGRTSSAVDPHRSD